MVIKYIIKASNASTNTPIITKSILNTWPPYTTKYPIPNLDTKNSPTMTPTHVKPMFILNILIKFLMLLGKINLNNICIL